MKPTFKHRLASLAAMVLLACAANTAGAQNYSFSQTGFDGGGSLSGTFSGSDLDNNGWLDFSTNEITAFSLTFSGDANVGAFSHGLDDLVGLVYRLDAGPFIGDDGPDGAGELIGSLGLDDILYQSGKGLVNSVTDLNTNAVSTTQQLVSVSAVPEPEGYALTLSGLALLWLRLKQTGTRAKHLDPSI